MKWGAFSFRNIKRSEVQFESVEAVRNYLVNIAIVISVIFGSFAVVAVLFREMAIGQPKAMFWPVGSFLGSSYEFVG